MKKLFVFLFALMFSFNAYAEITDCKYTLDMEENIDVFTSLFEDKKYSYKNSNEKICFTDGQGSMIAFPLKKGKLANAMEYQLNNNGKPVIYAYASSHKFIEHILSQAMNPGDLKGMSKFINKYNLIMEFYNDNGNKAYVIDLKKGSGSMTTYREDGTKELLIPVKKFRVHGKSEVYDEKGNLNAILKYKKEKLVSGQCIVDGKKGRKLTEEELINFKRTQKVDCSI